MSEPADRYGLAPLTGRGEDFVSEATEGARLWAAIADLERATLAEPQRDADVVLERFTALCAKHLRCVDRAGTLTIAGHGQIRSTAGTDAHTCLIQQLQEGLSEGPCWQSAIRGYVVRVDNLTREKRWPRFAEVVMSATPVRSILSLPLDLGSHLLGALGLYSDRTYGFGAEAEELAKVLTSRMGLALQNVEGARLSPPNLGGQDIIDQAKSLLMRRHKIGADEASTVLDKLSQSTQMPVSSVARQLIDRGGTWPDRYAAEWHDTDIE